MDWHEWLPQVVFLIILLAIIGIAFGGFFTDDEEYELEDFEIGDIVVVNEEEYRFVDIKLGIDGHKSITLRSVDQER